MKKFTIYWLTGSKEIVEGKDIRDAFHRRGIGAGAVPAIDFYTPGENNDYIWDTRERTWKLKETEK